MGILDRLVIPGVGSIPVLGKVFVDDHEHAKPRAGCLFCLQPIGDAAWERLTAPDGSYSVVVHTVCLNTRS